MRSPYCSFRLARRRAAHAFMSGFFTVGFAVRCVRVAPVFAVLPLRATGAAFLRLIVIVGMAGRVPCGCSLMPLLALLINDSVTALLPKSQHQWKAEAYAPRGLIFVLLLGGKLTLNDGAANSTVWTFCGESMAPRPGVARSLVSA